MLMAAFGDIHGNLPALQAVLDAIDAEGIQTVVNTGDTVVGYPWPDEVIASLRERDIPSAQSESDRTVFRFARKTETLRKQLAPDAFRAHAWAHEHLHSTNIEYLRSLPKCLLLTVDTVEITVCHGTPGNVRGTLDEDADVARFQREREVANTPLVICGRTHQAFSRMIEDTLFVNPGSVCPSPDARSEASYAVISTETAPWSAEIRWVAYDHAEAERCLRESGIG
jgi:putative phosphoesterase